MLVNIRPGNKLEFFCTPQQKRTVDALTDIGYQPISVHRGVNHDDHDVVGMKKGKGETLYITPDGVINHSYKGTLVRPTGAISFGG